MHDPNVNATLESLDAAFSTLVTGAAQIQGNLGVKASELKSQADALVSLSGDQSAALDRLVAPLRDQLDALRTSLTSDSGALEEQNIRLAALESEAAVQTALAGKERARADALATQCAALEAELRKLRETQAASEAALRDAIRQETAASLGAEFEAERAKLLGQVRIQESDLAKMRADLFQLQERLAGAVSPETVEQLKADAAAERDRLEAQNHQIEDELNEMRDALAAGLDAKAAQELRAVLAKEKERANMLDQRLRDETARGTKSVLAEQLADALKEIDALRDELRRLEAASAKTHDDAAAPATAMRSAQTEEAMLRRVAGSLRNGQKRTLGELLIEANIINAEQLDEALDEQRRNPHTHLGAIFSQKGFATSEAVAQALALQCNIGFVRLGETFVEPEATKLISGRLAAQHRCIPVRTVNDEGLIVAIANPLDLVAIEDIERSTGRRVEILVATEQEIRDAVEHHYATE